MSNLDAMKRLGLKVAMIFLFVCVNCLSISAQPADIVERMRAKDDSIMFKALFDLALTDGHAYKRLGELCKGVGSRLSGSDNAERGIVWALSMLKSYQFDTVFTQPVMVPRWERGEIESVKLYSKVLTNHLKSGKSSDDYNCEAFVEANPKPQKFYPLNACALGGSVGGHVAGTVIVVNSNRALDSLGKGGLLRGKIVLLNRAFDETLLNTFQAYGGCVSQRVNGAVPCSKYGALAVLVRSMSNRCDLHPHTGVTHYEDSVTKIPMVAVATAVADLLEDICAIDPNHRVEIELNCRTLPDRLSANVIASSVGSQYPEKIIDFGGHFDSWDEGEGAHDDGAGCMHAFEALRLLKALGYTPRHTLRCVFWINEENGLRGGTEYARLAAERGENHIAALESDRGGFVPRGFGVDSAIMPGVKMYQKLLDAYGIGTIEKGGGGADIGPLKKVNPNTTFVSFIPDSQRYFDVHHAETDVFENVNKRELHLGAAAVAAMIYILDQQLD
ncbi:MAG: hypothetical protein RL411_136 [Bacteroidota bacterium]